MPSYIEALGQGLGAQAGSGLIGNVFGLMMEEHNDRRQREQQEALGRIQLGFDKEMTDYSYMKQMQMWRDTNYKAQVEQMEAAGLNPALLYGMSGGGGATTGGGAASSKGTDAPRGGGEQMGIMSMSMQNALMGAQIKNIQADTKKKEVEATKQAGVDTEVAHATIADLKQGVDNKKAQEALTRVQTRIAEFDEQIKGETLEAAIKNYKFQTNKVMAEMQILQNESLISSNTWSQKIDMVEQELIGAIARNELTRTQTTKTAAETAQLAKTIALEYAKLANMQENTAIQKSLQEFQTSFGGQASNILGQLLQFLPGKKKAN